MHKCPNKAYKMLYHMQNTSFNFGEIKYAGMIFVHLGLFFSFFLEKFENYGEMRNI